MLIMIKFMRLWVMKKGTNDDNISFTVIIVASYVK